MSGFTALATQAVVLLLIVALVGAVVGWFFGHIRGTKITSERYESQLRATLRRMSAAESDAVTLRAQLEESRGVVAAQNREHESREHLLAALEARLAEAEGAAEDAKRMAESLAGKRPPAKGLENKLPKNRASRSQVNGEAGEAASPTDRSVDSPSTVGEVAARTKGDDKVPDDDLTRIKGVGKVIARTLNELGFTSYRQIARLTDADIDVVDQALELFQGRIRRDDWMSSAAALHKTDYGADA